jgi:lysophospholipase L1-like esterase
MTGIPNYLSLLALFICWPSYDQEIKENILENQHYQDRIAEFKQSPINQDAIVFLGNSLTEWGNWSLFFKDRHMVNRGIAGDNTLGILNRLDEIIKARPKAVFLLTGINDISLSRSADKIFTNMKSIVYQLQAATQNTKIYIQSVFPINNDFKRYKRLLGKEKEVKRLNKLLENFAKDEKITFINIYPSLIYPRRKDILNPKLTTDGLHLNSEGYAIWTSILLPYIEDIQAK